jgi:hypothetical protein
MSTLEEAAGAEDTAMLVAAGWVEPETLESLPTLAKRECWLRRSTLSKPLPALTSA